MGIEEEGNENAEEDLKQKLRDFKELLMTVLRDNGFADKRSSKLPWDQFLRLLQVMNENGIYFK